MKKKWMVLGLALLFAAALAGAPSPAAAELKVGVSGYVKLDVYYADKITGTGADPTPSNTPLDTNAVADNNQTFIDARESRLRATFSDEVMRVKISGRIEVDADTGESSAQFTNGRGIRLRLAYARADHPSGFFFLAGQNWSLFMNDIAAATSSPDLVDFNGPAGQLFARQPQLRVGYTMPLARGMGDLLVEADVEQHSVGDDAGNLGATATTQGEGQSVPLFAGKVSWLHPRIQAEAGFAVAENKAILATGADVSETAWGFQVSVNVNLDPFTIFGHYQIIDGLGRLAVDFPSAFLVAATNTIENVESNGFYVGATYNLTKDTSITTMYGWAEADEIVAAGFTGNDLETLQSIHVDLIHKFWERWKAGIEYRRFDVEAFNGTSGDVNIIQGAIWYFF